MERVGQQFKTLVVGGGGVDNNTEFLDLQLNKILTSFSEVFLLLAVGSKSHNKCLKSGGSYIEVSLNRNAVFSSIILGQIHNNRQIIKVFRFRKHLKK